MRRKLLTTCLTLSIFAACAGPNGTPPAPEVISPPLFEPDFPRLGQISLTAGDDRAEWFTTDRDTPSATFVRVSGVPTLQLRGYDVNDPDLRGSQSILITATFREFRANTAVTSTMTLASPSGQVIAGTSQDGFNVTIDAIVPGVRAGFAQITGTVTGPFCVTDQYNGTECAAVSGRFDTAAVFTP
jgi:hypothetical protein